MKALNETNDYDIKDRILFVDDEAFILFSLRRYFKQHNIEVDVETDCIKAVELVRENQYKVIISDFRMPTMNGADFLEVVKEVSPNSVRLMLSAHVTQEALLEIVNKSEVFRFISKPWRDKELLTIIQDSIVKYNKDAKSGQNKILISLQEIEQPISGKNEETQEEKLEIEKDQYLDNILPLVNYDNIDSKKLCEILRTEQHQFLNYIINLASSKIGNHCKRVSQLSVYVANVMKLSPESKKNLYYAGMYHDIGRIFELVAQADHSELGANLLFGFLELKDAAKIVRFHHKRLDLDGAGDIPIESKILAVVDHFDRLVNMEFDQELDEKARTLPDVLRIMELEKDKKLDSEVFEIFKTIILNDFKLDMFFNEIKIHITELEEGMVLSRPLFNIEGKMLLNSEYKITKTLIARIFKHNDITAIKNPFYIYAVVPEKKFNFEEIVKKIKI